MEHATELLASDWGIGYLLKCQVTDVDAVKRVAAGGTVLEPALIRELVSFSRRTDLLDALTSRERGVLALMAEGRSNRAIAHGLFVSKGTVEKHVRHIFTKLELADVPDDHRRVRAVIAFLSRR